MSDHDTPPQDATADSLAVVQRDLSDAHADLHQVRSVILREGPRSKKTARYVAVKNRHTGEVHHHALTLETGKKRQGSWELDDKRSISFSDEDDDEIKRLMDFLRLVRGEAAPAPAGTPSLAQLASLGGDEDGLKQLVRAVRECPDDYRAIAAAMTFGRYAQALERFKKLIAADSPTEALREVVAEHGWLVGSEYGALVPASELEGRALVRQTPSGRLEATVVGPVLGDRPLFDGDVLSGELAGALGEAMRLRELLDPVGGVTLMLLIGMRGAEAEQEALVRLNASLRGIEVSTYDQVLERGQRVLDVLRQTAKGAPRVRGPASERAL